MPGQNNKARRKPDSNCIQGVIYALALLTLIASWDFFLEAVFFLITPFAAALVDHFHGLAERRIDSSLVAFGNRSIKFLDRGFQFTLDRLVARGPLADVITLFLADLIFGKPYTSFFINPVLFIIPSYTFKCQVFFAK